MPVEVESTSQVEELLGVLRRRVWWILVPFLVCVSAATSFAVLVPKKYVASTRIMVRDVRGGDGKPLALAGGKAAAQLIRAPKRASAVFEELSWPWKTLDKVEQDVLMERTLDNLSVSTPAMGFDVAEQMVVISFAHTDPIKALEFLEEISKRWMEEVLETSRRAKRDAFESLKERRGDMEKDLERISTEIAATMREYDIPPWNPDNRYGEQQLAPAFEDMARYVEEERTLLEALERKLADHENDQQRVGRMEDVVSVTDEERGIDYNKKIHEVQQEIARVQAKLREEGYRPQHSKYAKLQEEIRSYEAQIELLEASETEGSRTERTKQNPAKLKLQEKIDKDWEAIMRDQRRLEALRAKIDDVRARAKELQTVYQDLRGLENERTRLNQALIDNEPHFYAMQVQVREAEAENPFYVVEAPKEPTRPTEPSPVLIVAFGLFLGAGLGLGLAVVGEYGRNCFRTVNDITRVMSVPILGTVNAIVTRRQRRRRVVARGLVVGLTFSIVLALGYVTWAWQFNQSLLSDDLLASIESFREAFE